ncbi:MAG: hypothetical protein FJZ05_00670 [Candidatus Nealsonbacteria bacterium]|nr:hypothetical protein [Candidatus Nealsonbacteria bacterium]
MPNFKKFLNKKVIFVFVFVLILIAGGLFFWWQEDKIENFLENRKLEKMIALAKDYTILEDSGEKFIVNQKDGFKIKIPTEWNAKIGMDMTGMESERYVTLYSKDFNYHPPQGCLVEIQISRLKERSVEHYGEDFIMYPYVGAKEVKDIIDSYKESSLEEQKNMHENGITTILIAQREALQETTILKESIGKYITIKIPTEDRVYIFEEVLFSDECDKEFEDFLETISI